MNTGCLRVKCHKAVLIRQLGFLQNFEWSDYFPILLRQWCGWLGAVVIHLPVFSNLRRVNLSQQDPTLRANIRMVSSVILKLT